jgi:hypothetical protein
MCARVQVVRDVVRKHAVKALCVHHNHVIEALASDRANESLRVGVLPRRWWRRSNLLDVHPFESRRDVRKDRIAIVQEIPGRLVLRKGVSQLLCCPGRCRMLGKRHVKDLPAVVRQDDEDEQQPEGDGRYHEEVGGHELARMIGEKRPPRL